MATSENTSHCVSAVSKASGAAIRKTSQALMVNLAGTKDSDRTTVANSAPNIKPSSLQNVLEYKSTLLVARKSRSRGAAQTTATAMRCNTTVEQERTTRGHTR